MKIYRVSIRRGLNEDKSIITHEFYAASHISKIYEALTLDLNDENTEVEEVIYICPILAILK